MGFTNVVTERGLTALLAEDDENDVLLIRRAVRQQKLVERLLVVSSGEEAMAYLQGEQSYVNRQQYPFPDVVILDQFMPRWSGLDVLLWLRSSPRFERLPVVLLSVGLSPTQIETVHLLRATCCQKTAQLEDLWEAMQAAIACSSGAGAQEGRRFQGAGALSTNGGGSPPQGLLRQQAC